MDASCWYALPFFLLACASDGTDLDSPRVEGRTPAVSNGASLYALRLWTAPTLDSLHRAGVLVDSLDVGPTELHMRIGERLSLSRLRVIALDSFGQTVPGAPIVLEVGSSALALTPEDVVARSPGLARLRVRSLLPNEAGSEEERSITIQVDR